MGKRNYLFMASQSNNRLWCWNLDSFMKEKEMNIVGQTTWPTSITLIISGYCFIHFVSRIPVLLHYCTGTYLNCRCCKLLICPQILCPRKYTVSLSSIIFHRAMNFIKHFFGFSSLGVRACRWRKIAFPVPMSRYQDLIFSSKSLSGRYCSTYQWIS